MVMINCSGIDKWEQIEVTVLLLTTKPAVEYSICTADPEAIDHMRTLRQTKEMCSQNLLPIYKISKVIVSHIHWFIPSGAELLYSTQHFSQTHSNKTQNLRWITYLWLTRNPVV